jgi:hypothetical protein
MTEHWACNATVASIDHFVRKRHATVQYANNERDRSHHGRRWNKCGRNNAWYCC